MTKTQKEEEKLLLVSSLSLFSTAWLCSARLAGSFLVSPEMKLCADIRVPLRSNPADYDDPLTFHLTPPSGQHFNVSMTFPSAILRAECYSPIVTTIKPAKHQCEYVSTRPYKPNHLTV